MSLRAERTLWRKSGGRGRTSARNIVIFDRRENSWYLEKRMKRALLSTFVVFGLALIIAGGVSAQKSVEGEWDGMFNTPGGTRPFNFVLKVDGEKLSGTAKRSSGDVPLTGTVKGSDITFSYTISYNGNNVTLTYTGKVNGDSMSGTVIFNETEGGEWSAKRAVAKQ